MNKGLVIVIDGIDGSGKTTQVNLLSKYLTNKNIPHEVISFPRYGQNLYADLVTRYLGGEFGSINEVNPYLIACAFAGDRLLAKSVVENWLNKGKIVIANRYVSSSKAHMGANLAENQKEEFIKWIDNLEYETNGMPKEDLNIFLNVDPEVGQENVSDKHTPDIHEDSLKHLEKAYKIYVELSKAELNWKTIDCMDSGKMKSPGKIHEDIIKILPNMLLSET